MTIVNFNAGPAGLPRQVVERAQKELVDFQGTGMSIMEHSHRGEAYDGVHSQATSLMKSVLGIPDTHEVLFLQGGASGQFAVVPMNFLKEGRSADYVITGAWSKKAFAEAQVVGTARSAGTGEVDGKFARIPKPSDLDRSSEAAYLHITSNNTIAGTQWHEFPEGEPCPLVADMSSDILCRPLDVSRFGLIYAGAQKNVGPSGVTIAIIKKDWAKEARTDIPKIFRYQTHLDAGSLFHTPPTFAIYMIRNVLEWIGEQGGLAGMQKRNQDKADHLYAAIDGSDGFYRSPIDKDARSIMNVVFRLTSEEAEKTFVAQAKEAGLVGLKGHRSVGGIRASIYNAVSPEGVSRLVDFMKKFKEAH